MTLVGYATLETVLMVASSSAIGIIFGVPFGAFLYFFSRQGLTPILGIYRIFDVMVNIARSIPYVILMILMIPCTRYMVGTSIGTMAAIVPLSLSAILLITRMTEISMQSLSRDKLEIGKVLGGASFRILLKIVIPEVLPMWWQSFVTIIIQLIGFSAMAGTVGGGGLGSLAVQYGYQRYDLVLLGIVTAVLVVLVQSVQGIGQVIYRHLSKTLK